MSELSNNLANLTIVDSEEEAICVSESDISTPFSFLHCFVGMFLTTSVIHFESMKNTLDNVWKPLGGISILELGERRYLFRLYHQVDVERIEIYGPWFFNSHMLLLHRLVVGDDPMSVLLNFLDLWILVHDLPIGFMAEGVAKQLGDFIGKFLEYDSQSISLNYKRIMRVKTRINVRLPLKRRKKIALQDGSSVYAHFQYEKIRIFCFLCGRLGHGESFCPARLTLEPENIVFNWDISLRAPPRRQVPASPWIKHDSSDSARDSRLVNTHNQGYNQGAQMGIPIKGSRNVMLESSNLLMEGQTFQVYNNPIQCPVLNDGLPTDGLPTIDVQMGFDSEDSPIEPSDGNKRSRKHYDSNGTSLKESEIDVEKIVSAGLIDQARREL
ncbi:hypothetical protein GQ457_17G012780 [Hibiscus cannabinus]